MTLEKIGLFHNDVFRWRIEQFKKSLINFWDNLKRRKSALFALVFIVVLVVISIFPHFFAPNDPAQRAGAIWEPPSPAHLLGTDDVGRDVLSQLIYGTRISILIGFLSASIALIIGMIVGVVSGFYGGIIGELLMRTTDFFLIIPNFPLMVVLAYTLKPSLETLSLAIAIGIWTQPARVIYAEVLSLRERPYILRAKVLGASNPKILLRYIIPRVMPIAFAMAIINMGWAIPSEAFLSWIGLSDPTQISWGSMLYYAFMRGSFICGAWWHFIPPGILIMLTVVAFMILGQAVQEISNPKLKHRGLYAL